MKARFWFILAIIAAVSSGVLIVANQRHLNSMMTSAVSKDVAGGDATADIGAVKAYAKGHMGTSVTMVLQGSYGRAKAAAEAAMNPASNGQVYAQAQAACNSKADSIVQSRCVQAYVTSHSQPAANPQAAVMPVAGDYTKTYKSPSFTPDSAGLSLLLAGVFAAVGLVQVARRR